VSVQHTKHNNHNSTNTSWAGSGSE